MSTFSRMHLFVADLDQVRTEGDHPRVVIDADDGYHSVTFSAVSPDELVQLGEAIVSVARQLSNGRSVVLRPPFGLAADDIKRDEDARIDAAVAAAEMDRRSFLDDPERRS